MKIIPTLSMIYCFLLPMSAEKGDGAAEKIKITKRSSESPNQDAKDLNNSAAPPNEDEISLVIKGKIISVTDKEIIYKETGSNTEGRAPIHNLHFLRRANGEYRFFTPAKTELKEPTQVLTEEVKPKEPASPIPQPPARTEFFLTGGGLLHFAKNSDSADYVSGLSAYVAKAANQANNPKGFTGQLSTDAAKIQYQAFIEPRIAYKQFMVGLNVGYAVFPKIAGTVSSPNYSNALTLSLDGYFIPAQAIFYYRLPLTQRFSLHLGLGGGVMYTSIRYTEDDTLTNNSQRYTAWSAVAIAKPEIAYRMGRIALLISTPFYFAESRKVESGSTALVNGDTGKVISPNLTGFGVSIALGYQLR